MLFRSNASIQEQIAKIPEAAAVLFGAAEPAPVSRISPEQWAKATTARPTSRNGAAEPKGKRAAVKALQVKLDEMGHGRKTSSEGDELESELPD